MIGRIAVASGAAFLLLGAPAALAHPLGNFSINHSHNLTFEPHLVVDRAVVDFAEIPTAQSKEQTDADGDGRVSPAELQARGTEQCAELNDAVDLTVDATAVPFTVASASYAYVEGQAGLPTGRLECRFEAVVDLTVPHEVSFDDGFAADRVGWHEITAIGQDVTLSNSPLPQTSGTDELRHYPLDLLGSPLNVRDVALSVSPGSGTSGSDIAAVKPNNEVSIFRGGPLAGAVERITGRFNDLIGRNDLTFGVGLLAVTLAMILGASHALLPGHGKTVMAAYIAGRQGSSRDAVIVGATVTATHTGGVLLLGLALTVSSSLAGESVLGWLGVISGLIIATLGTGLLIGAARGRTSDHHTHSHRFGHSHHHAGAGDHARGDRPSRPFARASVNGTRTAIRSVQITARTQADDRGGRSSVLTMARPVTSSARTLLAPTASRRHATVRFDEATQPPRHVSRRGLVGMGIAGGLVPSPSALIVLLSAIALGRTIFGVVLVIGYGLGMAATLTLAGLLLVRVRDRLQRRNRAPGRASTLARRWSTVAPYATASLVVVVGAGIALRGVSSIVG